jgi:hypothetical protein
MTIEVFGPIAICTGGGTFTAPESDPQVAKLPVQLVTL